MESRRDMIAVAHPLAVETGHAMLRSGGGAVDAAIAAQLVLGLVEPQSSGLGGGAFMLVHDARATDVRDRSEPHAMDAAAIFSATVLLLLVIDPFGNVPIVVAALARVPAARRARVVLRECLAAYVVLLAFMLGGRTFLRWLQLSEVSLGIAGGIILFLIALRMVFRHPEGVFGDAPGSEPFLVPLAVPAIAGPSALATVMLMASRDPAHLPAWIGALTAAMLVAAAVLVSANRLQQVLGERGMLAVERLMGLVLTALAVQMLLDGVRAFVASLSN